LASCLACGNWWTPPQPVKPNGAGVLGADSLQFDGLNLLGDSVRWVYAPVQLQRPKSCT
jgi:hypothetical protein